MNKPRLIERMAQHREERKLNKPKYKIEDLHVGKIIYIVDKKFEMGSCLLDSGYRYSFQTVKPFAIFNNDGTYLHIVSNSPLRTSTNAEIGEYCIKSNSIKQFDKYLQRYMIANNLKKTSKLSINAIKELEDYVNKELYPEQEKDELFY